MKQSNEEEEDVPSPPPFYRVSGHFTALNPSRPMALAKRFENAATTTADERPPQQQRQAKDENHESSTPTAVAQPMLENIPDSMMTHTTTKTQQRVSTSSVGGVPLWPTPSPHFEERLRAMSFDSLVVTMDESTSPISQDNSNGGGGLMTLFNTTISSPLFHQKLQRSQSFPPATTTAVTEKPPPPAAAAASTASSTLSDRMIQTPEGLALLLHANTSSRTLPISTATTSEANRQRGARWTPEEDELLRAAVELGEGPPHNWKYISKKYFHGSRNALACKGRWTKNLQPGLLHNKWTVEEDARILQGFKNGLSWPDIAQTLPGRLTENVRVHFLNELDPSLNRAPFSEREKQKVRQLQAQYGNKWTQIASQLPGRSVSMVKNCWYSIKMTDQRKLRRSSKQASASNIKSAHP